MIVIRLPAMLGGDTLTVTERVATIRELTMALRQARPDLATRLDDSIFNLVGHAEPVTSADCVCFQHEIYVGCEALAIQFYRLAFVEPDSNFFALHFDIVAPGGYAHDRFYDRHAGF